MKERICPLIHLNCPSNVNCSQCINVPQSPAFIELQSAISQTLDDVSNSNQEFKDMLVNDHNIIPHLTRPLIYYKIGIHFNKKLDLQSLSVRHSSRRCLRQIHEFCDVSAQTELVNDRYARVFVIAIISASGAGEEQGEEIYYRLSHISWLLRNLNKGRPFTFPPQHLLARRSDEQIEEEGGNEEIESQLINKGFSGNIKNEAKVAKRRILNYFIEWGNQRPDWYNK
ncbi:MAG: hypothetical protein EZS28_047083 [Streblomastix strix]|uniref:Uncharacterized protein n=1 Tax=Streblomastix strix TaxID=222440 RepID=A0A5J4TI19_9EUKA|nr:MAG: hypothetical protein EZS28_047083 [Streblomastix strix]